MMPYARSRFSDRGVVGTGLHPVELWGVAMSEPTHVWNERARRVEPRQTTKSAGAGARRGDAARARRRAKRAAKAMGLTLKGYLRRQMKAAA